MYPSLFHIEIINAIRHWTTIFEYDDNVTTFMIQAFILIQDTSYCKYEYYNSENIFIRLIALQIKGIAMGTCDSPYDANLTLLMYEDNNISKI